MEPTWLLKDIVGIKNNTQINKCHGTKSTQSILSIFVFLFFGQQVFLNISLSNILNHPSSFWHNHVVSAAFITGLITNLRVYFVFYLFNWSLYLSLIGIIYFPLYFIYFYTIYRYLIFELSRIKYIHFFILPLWFFQTSFVSGYQSYIISECYNLYWA